MVIIHCKFYANWSTSSYFFALSKVVRFFFFAIVIQKFEFIIWQGFDLRKIMDIIDDTYWIVKNFEKSFDLDRSQLCISNDWALQREALICENAFLHRDCKTEMGNVFAQTIAISKRKKIAIPNWRQMNFKRAFRSQKILTCFPLIHR